MTCEHCGQPIRDTDDVRLLSFLEDRYAHTDCEAR